MHILVAPNAFKNSLNAQAAAEAICRGLQRSKLNCSCQCFPIADGGDGTASLLVQRLGGATIPVAVHDPLGRKITAAFGWIDRENTAVIELADASGLRLLRREEYNPLRLTTRGTGELIHHALARGARRILLAIGGSATVDGGVGILEALGVRFRNAQGLDLTNVPEDLAALETIDTAVLNERIRQCELIVLCDVENPLLGKQGAARVFGPQKGATDFMVKRLELGLTKFCEAVRHCTGKDISAVRHGGAAGGVSAGLYGVLNARLVKGIDSFFDLTGFDAALEKADLVITGEGRMDGQTLEGKGPIGVALRARQKNIPVIALAGSIAPEAIPALRRHFDQLLAIASPDIELETALQQTGQNLERIALELANRLSAD